MENKHGLPLLNVANSLAGTRMLGPGWRSVVWVQGCGFDCPGCIAPEWHSNNPARLVTPQELAAELLADPRVDGLTFSGGEPMLQAAGLAELARLTRAQRELSIICFTGFTLDALQGPDTGGTGWHAAAAALLAQVDVLIDGPYVEELNDNRGLRGSSNQRVQHLSGRLRDYDFENAPRRAEIRLAEGYAMLVGVPTQHLEQGFQQALSKARKLFIGQEKPG